MGATEQETARAWHAQHNDEALSALSTSSDGLTVAEARRRLDENGPNLLSQQKPPGPLTLMVKQLRSPLILMLLAAAGISVVAQHPVDAVVILVVVSLNTIIGMLQEWRAEKAMEALRKLSAAHAQVMRDGRPVTIESAEVVVGDILLLETGDSVAADVRLIEALELTVDESALTGESEPVDKAIDPLPQDTEVADRTNMAWSTTPVTGGRGRGVVVATAMDTVIGRIATDVQATQREDTPLQRRLSRLGIWIGSVSVGAAVSIFVFGLLRGLDPTEMLLFAVAAAVSAIPEGLPAVISVVLAVGVQRMSHRNAIVRRLPAVETLGSTTVICSDKTGTITRNQMSVRRIWTAAELDRDDDGSAPGQPLPAKGATRPQCQEVLCRIGVLVNNARLERREGDWKVLGSPTDGALLIAAHEMGVDRKDFETDYTRLGEIPFSSERKYAAALLEFDGTSELYVKGAPERLLDFSTHVLVGEEERPLTPELRERIQAANHALAGQALRVIAGAYRRMDPSKTRASHEDAEADLVFVGMWGLIDPPREEAIEAIKTAQGAKIRIVMITGDHTATASAIARDVGIAGHGEQTVSGEELNRMSDEELAERVQDIAVYARVAPEHKFRIVRALKKHGHVVAMTGDGVNDAPALKAADIGIAMGVTGTEVAKEAADIVLGDDNFATIVDAVEEGRVIFANLRRVVAFLVATTSGEVLTLFAALALGLQLPVTAVMILWINLVTDGISTIPLGLEPRHADVLKQPPRSPKEGVITPVALTRAFANAILTAAGTLILFSMTSSTGSLARAQTAAFTTLVAFEWFKSITWRTSNQSVFRVGLFSNRWLVLALAVAVPLQIAAVHTRIGQIAFGTEALTLSEWAVILAVGSSALVLDEIGKLVFGRLGSR